MSKKLEFKAKRTNMPIIILESGKRNRWRRGNNYITKKGRFLWLKRDFSLKSERAPESYAQLIGEKISLLPGKRLRSC